MMGVLTIVEDNHARFRLMRDRRQQRLQRAGAIAKIGLEIELADDRRWRGAANFRHRLAHRHHDLRQIAGTFVDRPEVGIATQFDDRQQRLRFAVGRHRPSVVVTEFDRPALHAGAGHGLSINLFVAFLQFRRQVAGQVAVFHPLRMHLIVERLDPAVRPTDASFGFGNQPEHPGIADDAADVGHAAVTVLVDAGIDAGIHLKRRTP